MSNDKETGDSKETTSPEWLNAEMIQEALHRDGETDIQVTGLEMRAAIAPGENYGSALYRVKATLLGGREQSLIVKALPPGEAMAAVVVETGVFQREIAVLARAIPQMEALLEGAAPGRWSPLAPRCLRHGCAPYFILMEDLAPQGFKCADRHRGLGVRHCLVALRALARFHAASYAFLKSNASVANQLDNPWNTQNTALGAMVDWSVQGVVDVCRELTGMEEITPCLEAFKTVALETFTNLRNVKPGAFNVIIHGDFWINNMMFRYEDGEPRDIRFVDLQDSQVASATLDLLYFLSTSPSENVSTHYEDLLVREYHVALVETMELLGLKPPSLEALLAEMDANGTHALYGAVFAFPIIKADKAVDLDAAMDGDGNSDTESFRRPVVKNWLKRLLPEYKRKGWLSG